MARPSPWLAPVMMAAGPQRLARRAACPAILDSVCLLHDRRKLRHLYTRGAVRELDQRARRFSIAQAIVIPIRCRRYIPCRSCLCAVPPSSCRSVCATVGRCKASPHPTNHVHRPTSRRPSGGDARSACPCRAWRRESGSRRAPTAPGIARRGRPGSPRDTPATRSRPPALGPGCRGDGILVASDPGSSGGRVPTAGSCTWTSAPSSISQRHSSTEPDRRSVSVPGLYVRPQTAMRVPRNEPSPSRAAGVPTACATRCSRARRPSAVSAGRARPRAPAE